MELNPPIQELEELPGDEVLQSTAFFKKERLREFCKQVWGFDWRDAERGLIIFNGKINVTGFIREAKKIKGEKVND